jgi:hypothetical protein
MVVQLKKPPLEACVFAVAFLSERVSPDYEEQVSAVAIGFTYISKSSKEVIEVEFELEQGFSRNIRNTGAPQFSATFLRVTLSQRLKELSTLPLNSFMNQSPQLFGRRDGSRR